jgi:hypothetical protein
MMRSHVVVWALLAATLTPGLAGADPLLPRETADVRGADSGSVGLFNPLRLGFSHAEIELHPVAALVAPHADLRMPLLRAQQPGDWRTTAILGLALPSPAWRMEKPFGFAGDLVPSCKVADIDPKLASWCDRPGWMLSPKFGVQVSKGLAMNGAVERGVLTLAGEVATGWLLSGKAARPLDAWAPAAVQFAPYIGRFRAQARAAYDHAVTDWLRLRAEVAGYYVERPADDPLSPWYASVHVGADVQTSEHTRIALGAIYWNYDKHQRTVAVGADGYATATYGRSHEVWPAVDLVWQWGSSAPLAARRADVPASESP